ncbi:MAG: alpha/beta hydrolase, partial [Acidobacteria bacterium]
MRVLWRTSPSVSATAAAMLLEITAAGPAVAAPAIPKASWNACFKDFGPNFQCATVQVPLDYDGPADAAISIAMVRLPASDPARRIGSLFINPGGPGGSGVEFALFAGPFLFTPEVRARFDIVGFDPRGIARSTALRCFGNPRQWTPYFTPFAFPITAEEEAQWEAADHYLDDACAQRGARIEDHMATADVARDLESLRQAVGDEKLTYYGVSYGSFLGQTYANLFPNSFRALVIDGVLDPIAWTTGAAGQQGLPFSTRLRSDAGAQATLDEFFRLCDAGGANCPFSGGAADRFAALAARLRSAPIQIIDPATGQPFPFTYQALIANSLFAMYDSFSWPALANLLAFLESQ